MPHPKAYDLTNVTIISNNVTIYSNNITIQQHTLIYLHNVFQMWFHSEPTMIFQRHHIMLSNYFPKDYYNGTEPFCLVIVALPLKTQILCNIFQNCHIL